MLLAKRQQQLQPAIQSRDQILTCLLVRHLSLLRCAPALRASVEYEAAVDRQQLAGDEIRQRRQQIKHRTVHIVRMLRPASARPCSYS